MSEAYCRYCGLMGHPFTECTKSSRPSWDEYFLWHAEVASSRATCSRKHVGAVIVRGNRQLCTGYNGSIAGSPHCDEAGHIMEDNHCVRVVHAEANAIATAARYGVSIEGATCYTTASPCFPCLKLLANAGIAKIIYAEEYRMDPKVKDHVKSHSWDGKIGTLIL